MQWRVNTPTDLGRSLSEDAMKKLIIVFLIMFSASAVFAELSKEQFREFYKEIATERDSLKKIDRALYVLKKCDAYQKFLILKEAAYASFDLKQYDDAKMYATQMLSLSNGYSTDWNYGNAVHNGNLILGRVALQQNDIEGAKEYLLKAGQTTGSPQLKSFGPNMSLANDLLEKDEKQTVIEYFELCKKFWKMNDGRLDSWIASIKGGGKPYFGTNLKY